MRGHIGDRLIVSARHTGEPVRSGEILEVHGPDGAPPYLVRWADSDTEALVIPGPDSRVEPRRAG